MHRGSLILVAVTAAFTSTGCGQLLTPDVVREHLKNPKGAVAKDTVGRSTRDFFSAKHASGAESLAFFSMNNGSEAESAVSTALAARARGVQLAGEPNASDVFCTASFAAALLAFDSCGSGRNCEADLTIDACVLRIGEGGDERARGKIVFKVKNTVEADLARSELRITFEDFETSKSDEAMQYLDGIVALETTEHDDGSSSEVILTADFVEQTRGFERGFFDDGVQSTARHSAAVRFTTETEDNVSAVQVELLAFVDADDSSRNESVVLSFGATETRLTEDETLTSAALHVRGSNGSFQCTWTTAEEEIGDEGRNIQSAGHCVDDDGEEFNFESDVTAS